MPTILELFRGSNKDITPKILDLTPVQELFIGSTQEKSVKPDKLTLIEQELSGIRIKTKVELNNPLIASKTLRLSMTGTAIIIMSTSSDVSWFISSKVEIFWSIIPTSSAKSSAELLWSKALIDISGFLFLRAFATDPPIKPRPIITMAFIVTLRSD